MNNILKTYLLVVTGLLIMSCGNSLDASKVGKRKTDLTDSGCPITLSIPAYPGIITAVSETTDMLLYKEFSINIRNEVDFDIEIFCSTLEYENKLELLEEQLNAVKNEEGFQKIVVSNNDGFLYVKKEVNGDDNYNFIKVITYEGGHAVINPSPATDGSLSLEKAQYIFDIINAE